VCPAPILWLRREQEAAAEEGYGDQVSFLHITFDPKRDTAEALRKYAGQQGVDLDANKWHFLRPETYEQAQEIHDEHFGLKIEKQLADDVKNLEYRFWHYGRIILGNNQRIIKRAYPRGPRTDIKQLVDDLERVATV
jgi:protein SCO1/2